MVTGFAALVMCALSQTFIIGLSHVDLGVGNFCGLVNVLCCTFLFDNPILGAAMLLIALAAYPLMGYVICKRNVPAIIVTLGASFVWSGIALSVQSMPGGTCPAWIRSVFYTNTPILNTLCFWLIAFLIAAVLIYRSRYGTVLRGFGNNENAIAACRTAESELARAAQKGAVDKRKASRIVSRLSKKVKAIQA